MESKKCNKLVNITEKQQTHRYREQASGKWGVAAYGSGVGGINFWVKDRLKNIVYSTGNIVNIL